MTNISELFSKSIREFLHQLTGRALALRQDMGNDEDYAKGAALG